MRVSERLGLIDRIGRELQARYSYTEIDTYLHAFGIHGLEGNWGSKWVYSKAALRDADVETLGKIAQDLDIDANNAASTTRRAPQNWANTRDFKLFISHLSKDKDKATRLKSCLDEHAISGFVAHEDIEPTREWQDEIERALRTMDALVVVLTAGFSKSVWTNQEIGFALGRDIKIISFKMGEDPPGFISKRQALPHRQRRAEEIASELDRLLLADPATAPALKRAKEARRMSTRELDEEIPF